MGCAADQYYGHELFIEHHEYTRKIVLAVPHPIRILGEVKWEGNDEENWRSGTISSLFGDSTEKLSKIIHF